MSPKDFNISLVQGLINYTYKTTVMVIDMHMEIAEHTQHTPFLHIFDLPRMCLAAEIMKYASFKGDANVSC